MKEITFLTDDELKNIIDGCVDGVYPTTQETAMANELITVRARIKELESECANKQLLEIENQRLKWLIANMMSPVEDIKEFEYAIKTSA